MRSQEITEIVSIWAADHSLSRRKKAFLETVYSQFIEADGMASPDVAGHAYASQLDLPPGSCTIQVVAALLDRMAPLPGSERRLVEVTEELVEFDHISREAADATYEAALYLPLAPIPG
jgi:hypothetical protein